MEQKIKKESSSSQEDDKGQESAVYPINLRAGTKFFCMGENENELSFKPHEIITNVVKLSSRPGWLLGTINGKTGQIPESYVEFLPHQ